jgi:hypothetical protein
MSVVSYSVFYQGVSITAQIACVGLSNAGIILSQLRDCYLNGCAWDTTSHKLQFEIRQIGSYAPWQCDFGGLPSREPLSVAIHLNKFKT